METKSIDYLAQILWNYNCLYDQLEKVDLIFVMGSHDIRVARRGAELFLHGYATHIIFSGNVGKLTKEMWDKPEAQVFGEEAIKMGVPKDSILIEDKSTNTGENVQFTKQLLEAKGLYLKKIILVQKPYMQRRAFATFKKLWSEPELIVTAPETEFDKYPNETITKDALINILVGDTQRIILYPEKGFQIPQDMPVDVRNALEELIKRGYKEHLIK